MALATQWATEALLHQSVGGGGGGEGGIYSGVMSGENATDSPALKLKSVTGLV